MNTKFRGQSLIESVIAIAVVMLLLTGLFIGSTSSLTASTNSSLRTKAVQIAQNGLEYARIARDTSWSDFIATYTNGTYCFDTAIKTVGTCTADPTYISTIVFSDDTSVAGGRHVVSTVTWTENNVSRSVQLQTTLTSWK